MLDKAFDSANKDWQPVEMKLTPGHGVRDGKVLTPAALEASIDVLNSESDIWANIQ